MSCNGTVYHRITPLPKYCKTSSTLTCSAIHTHLTQNSAAAPFIGTSFWQGIHRRQIRSCSRRCKQGSENRGKLLVHAHPWCFPFSSLYTEVLSWFCAAGSQSSQPAILSHCCASKGRFARGGEEKTFDPCKWEKGETDGFILSSLVFSLREIIVGA